MPHADPAKNRLARSSGGLILVAERGGDAQLDLLGQRTREADFGVARGAEVGEAVEAAIVDAPPKSPSPL